MLEMPMVIQMEVKWKIDRDNWGERNTSGNSVIYGNFGISGATNDDSDVESQKQVSGQWKVLVGVVEQGYYGW